MANLKAITMKLQKGRNKPQFVPTTRTFTVNETEERIARAFFKDLNKEEDLTTRKSILESFAKHQPKGLWYKVKSGPRIWDPVYVIDGDRPPNGAKKYPANSAPPKPRPGWKRSEFITMLLNIVPPNLWGKFTDNYLDQESMRYFPYLQQWIDSSPQNADILEHRIAQERSQEIADSLINMDTKLERHRSRMVQDRIKDITAFGLEGHDESIFGKFEIDDAVIMEWEESNPNWEEGYLKQNPLPTDNIIENTILDMKDVRERAQKKFNAFLKRNRNKSGKVEKPFDQQTLNDNSPCENLYASYPWLGKDIEAKTYLRPLEGDDDKSSLRYYYRDAGVEIANNHIVDEPTDNSKTFYRARPSFFHLQCGKYRSERTQVGNILTLYADFNDGRTVKRSYAFEVAIEVADQILIQEEGVFELENKYYNKKIRKQGKKILAIGTANFVDVTIREFARKELGRSLRSTLENGEKEEYGYIRKISLDGEWVITEKSDTPFIMALDETIFKKGHANVNEYLSNIAQFTIFFMDWTNRYGNSNFKKRVSEMYYYPEMLGMLTIVDKLPSVFSDPLITEEQKMEVASRSDREAARVVNDYLLFIFTLMYPERKMFHAYLSGIIEDNDRVAWIRHHVCENFNENTDVNAYELEPYLDGNGKYYCYKIPVLIEMFYNDNYINGYTGARFSQSFVDFIRMKYSYAIDRHAVGKKRDLDKMQEDARDVDAERAKKRLALSTSAPDYAPGLMDEIVEDIRALENELSDNQRGETNDKEIEKKWETTGNKPDDTAACSYCDELVKNGEQYKSIVFDKDGSNRIVNFCSTKCMERTGDRDWPKEKKEKKKKKRKMSTPIRPSKLNSGKTA
jgi:hypothetical protein